MFEWAIMCADIMHLYVQFHAAKHATCLHHASTGKRYFADMQTCLNVQNHVCYNLTYACCLTGFNIWYNMQHILCFCILYFSTCRICIVYALHMCRCVYTCMYACIHKTGVHMYVGMHGSMQSILTDTIPIWPHTFSAILCVSQDMHLLCTTFIRHNNIWWHQLITFQPVQCNNIKFSMPHFNINYTHDATVHSQDATVQSHDTTGQSHDATVHLCGTTIQFHDATLQPMVQQYDPMMQQYRPMMQWLIYDARAQPHNAIVQPSDAIIN